MPAPRKFDDETRDRAVRMHSDYWRGHPESKLAARKHVGGLLNVNPATLRNWIESEERAERPGEAGSREVASPEEARALRRRFG